jgi:NAD(P)-dependent dehydrogenase (short-subunit alcohol dehydrogenase family)
VHIPDWSLNGKVAVVTGTAPGGIGEIYARTLAAAGASVVCADLLGDGARQVARTITGEGHAAVAATVDITDRDSVAAMVDTAVSAYGGIDILVNNAALMAQLPQTPILEYDVAQWRRAMEVNLDGAYLCCRAVAPHLRARGGGRIVNQTSGGAFPPSTVYGITTPSLPAWWTARRAGAWFPTGPRSGR